MIEGMYRMLRSVRLRLSCAFLRGSAAGMALGGRARAHTWGGEMADYITFN